MAVWKYRADKTLALKLRSLIDAGGYEHDLDIEAQEQNAKEILRTVKAIAEKLTRHDDISYEMKRLIDDIDDNYLDGEDLIIGDGESNSEIIEAMDYFLAEFFDYCDGYRIWVELA